MVYADDKSHPYAPGQPTQSGLPMQPGQPVAPGIPTGNVPAYASQAHSMPGQNGVDQNFSRPVAVQSDASEQQVAVKGGAQSAKIVIAGGFGVGKTTFVGSVSEIEPLTTEAAMTSAASAYDDNSQVQRKTTTTVAMDFGRITIDAELVLYLFGTPGQDRFEFMWDDIVLGALVAIVLVDTRRLDQCFPAVDYFEMHEIPFIVAINQFDQANQYSDNDIREALDLQPHVPMVYTDARNRELAKETLIAALEYLLVPDPKQLATPAFDASSVTAPIDPSQNWQPGSPINGAGAKEETQVKPYLNY